MPEPAHVLDLETAILVVDDDPGIRELLANFLIAHGYIADTAEGATAMRLALSRRAYALVVLDVMMPGEDGLAVLRSLDRADAPAVIMLSTIAGDIDRIVGLEMGADDYVGKPANPRELLARIRSVLRRKETALPAQRRMAHRAFQRFAGWRFDPIGRELYDPDDVIIHLSDGEFRLLIALTERPRRVLSRDMLLDLSRGPAAENFDRAIDVQISRLRRKMSRLDGQGGDDLIRTVRNEGYMFSADVEIR
ncbi:MAG: response regulator [Sphingomonas sp.]|nr:MAG: response regulator [Sphingomonas sp.]